MKSTELVELGEYRLHGQFGLEDNITVIKIDSNGLTWREPDDFEHEYFDDHEFFAIYDFELVVKLHSPLGRPPPEAAAPVCTCTSRDLMLHGMTLPFLLFGLPLLVVLSSYVMLLSLACLLFEIWVLWRGR
jgi:hypothetical protein